MNMIQNAKDQVLDLTVSAYQKAAAEGLLPQTIPPPSAWPPPRP